jgi:hypothetical protein
MAKTRFEQAFDRLASRLQDRDGRSVRYQQGSIIIDGKKAVPTDETYKVQDSDGFYTNIQSTDWIWTTADLSDLKPRPGDRISFHRDGIEHVYEVFPIEKLPCAEWHDNSGVMTVIHTKKIQ